MDTQPDYTRPPFPEALKAWKQFLADRGMATELIWVFEENLCFEKDPSKPEGYRLGFQTLFTPPPPSAEQIAYEHFSEFEAPVVWYRLGASQGKSVCALLCDPWFARKTEAEGFTPRPRWRMLSRPGPSQELEHIQDKPRWEKRLLKDRPLQDLSFCMSLRSVHETLAHGRVLSAYEHYALRFLHVWRHWLGDSH